MSITLHCAWSLVKIVVAINYTAKGSLICTGAADYLVSLPGLRFKSRSSSGVDFSQ